MHAGVERRDFRAVLRHEVVIEQGMKILDDRSETIIGIDRESGRLPAARLVQHAAHGIVPPVACGPGPIVTLLRMCCGGPE